MADEESVDPRPGPATPPAKPPLLDYPTPTAPGDRDTEPWSAVARALLVIFGVIGLLFFIAFGVCGMLGRGCS